MSKYFCTSTLLYVSSNCYICVLILLHMCPHTTIYLASSYYHIRVLILLYMCPHLVSQPHACGPPHRPLSLYMCPHTAVYVSSYCCICVLILLYMCPHTATYVSSYCYISVLCHICVLILLYICPHAAVRGSLTSQLAARASALLLTSCVAIDVVGGVPVIAAVVRSLIQVLLSL